MLKPGQIIVYNNIKGGWFSALQRFFTRMNFTHASIGFPPIAGQSAVIEAKNVITITPFDRTRLGGNVEYWIFSVDGLVDVFTKQIVESVYMQYAGKQYGYLQLIYFVRRYIWETRWVKFLFGWLPELLDKPKDVRRWNNWFVSGTICSELVWVYLNMLSRAAYINNREGLIAKLSGWNSNNFHAGDVYNLCTSVPGITLIKKRTLENGVLITKFY